MPRLQAILATLAVAAAAVLVGGMPASASRGGQVVTPEEAGYSATGAQFHYVQAQVFLRNPAQYCGYGSDEYGHTVQLRSADQVAVLSAFTGGCGGYADMFTVYSPVSHAFITGLGAPGVTATFCTPTGGCHPAAQEGDTFPTGETITEDLNYNPSTGNMRFRMADATGRVLAGSDDAGLGESFREARIGTEFNFNDPFDSPFHWVQPPSSMKIAAIGDVLLTTYSGHKSTLSSWWTHSKLIARMTSTGVQMASPSDLTANGAAFQVNLTGAG